MNIDIHKILEHKFSHRKYSCTGDGDDYQIIYLDDLPPITKDELAKAKAELLPELEKKDLLRRKEDAYKKEIYPFLDNAKMLAELDGDNTKLEELKLKKKEIDARHTEEQT